MSSVKTNRPLMELVAEAKAEVMDEMEEDSNEEADEDENHDIAAVSASLFYAHTNTHSFCARSSSGSTEFTKRARGLVTMTRYQKVRIRGLHSKFTLRSWL